LPREQLLQRAGNPNPELLTDFIGPLPSPGVTGQVDIVVPEQSGYVVALGDLSGADDGYFHGAEHPR
jgi:hypothetical protein